MFLLVQQQAVAYMQLPAMICPHHAFPISSLSMVLLWKYTVKLVITQMVLSDNIGSSIFLFHVYTLDELESMHPSLSGAEYSCQTFCCLKEGVKSHFRILEIRIAVTCPQHQN